MYMQKNNPYALLISSVMESCCFVQADLELLESSDSFTNTIRDTIHWTASSQGSEIIVEEEEEKV